MSIEQIINVVYKATGADKVVAANKNVEKTMKKQKTTGSGFWKVMMMNSEAWKKLNKQGTKFTTASGQVANRTRLLTQGMRGFKMELLGVMFFGAAVSGALFAMARPAADMVGIFDLLNIALGLLFLPIMIELLPLVTDFIDKVTEMDDATKLWTGGILLTVGALFAMLAVFGMVALGLGSLFKLFGGATAIESFGAILNGLGATIRALGPLFAVIILLWLSDLGGFREMVGSLFDGLVEIIKAVFIDIFGGIIDIFNGLMAILGGDWDKAWELIVQGSEKIFMGLIKIIATVASIVLNAFTWLWNAVIDLFFKVVIGGILFGIQKILEAVGWVADKMGLEDIASGTQGAVDQLAGARAGVNAFADQFHVGYIDIKGVNKAIEQGSKFTVNVKTSDDLTATTTRDSGSSI